MTDGEQQDAAGLTAEERAEGERLVRLLPTDARHGAWTFTPWEKPDTAPGALGTVKGADGGNVAAVWPGRSLAVWDGDEARATVWLVNHASRLLADADALAGALAEVSVLRAALDLLKPLRRPEDWGLLAVRRADNEVRGVFRWPHETVDETIAHIRVHWPDGEIAGWVWVDAEAERRYRAALAPQSDTRP